MQYQSDSNKYVDVHIVYQRNIYPPSMYPEPQKSYWEDLHEAVSRCGPWMCRI